MIIVVVILRLIETVIVQSHNILRVLLRSTIPNRIRVRSLVLVTCKRTSNLYCRIIRMTAINISRDIKTNIYAKINRNSKILIYIISMNMSTRNITDLRIILRVRVIVIVRSILMLRVYLSAYFMINANIV